ncbi:MAG: hypothetical protein AB7G44_03550 [Bacteroidia bacterium]
MQRALSVMDILNKKRELLSFEGEWLHSFGRPEVTGAWLIWGGSGHGKTTFVMQLCKYLTRFERVLYDSLEERDGETIKMALLRVNMREVRGRFTLVPGESISDLKNRLRKKKSPRIVVIDSSQYSGLTYPEYIALLAEFKRHLFLLISHADGKLPSGKTANRIRYDAHVKIRVEGYRAFITSRYKEGEKIPFTIWEEGAEKYHGLQ